MASLSALRFLLVPLISCCLGGGVALGETLDSPLSTRGTVSFIMEIPSEIANGTGDKSINEVVLSVEGLAAFVIDGSRHSIDLRWNWEETATGFDNRDLIAQLPTLPGPEKYHVLITWDVGARTLDGYINGTPLKTPGAEYETWDFAGQGERWVTPSEKVRVTDVRLSGEYVKPGNIPLLVPEELKDRRREIFSIEAPRAVVDWSARRGGLLYGSSFQDEASLDGWVMEGPGLLRFGDGMQLSSERPDAAEGNHGHFVYWCPVKFPANFMAEWDIRIQSEYGLTIVFFSAMGTEGRDIFDSSLPKRDGDFRQYIRGELTSYHISYFASTENMPGRSSSNLRKNNNFYMLTQGPVGIEPGEEEWVAIRLIKEGSHIRFLVDDRVIIDYRDDHKERYGPALEGGFFGFRQMQWTTAEYRNLRIHELLPEGGNDAN